VDRHPNGARRRHGGYRHAVRINKDMLAWGVFFLVAGGVPLAVQTGLFAPALLDRWWSFWPLILIGIGIGLVFTRTPLEALGGLLVAGTFGLLVGGALASGFGGLAGFPTGVCGPDEGGVPFAPRSGTLASEANVRVSLDCGEVDISTAISDGWLVEGTDDTGTGPQIDGGQDELDIESAADGSNPFGERDRWFVTLPTGSLLDLELELNAGRMTIDLEDARLAALNLDLNAGEAIIDLRGVAEIEGVAIGINAGELALDLPAISMTGSIEANAGSIRLCAPHDVALRLHTGDSVLSSQDFGDAGLVQVGDAWETPGYDTAVTRIELRTEANAGSFQLDPEEGCS
jgi:hypothetical protein